MVAVLSLAPARAADSLHDRIDALIESESVAPAAPVADDATFLRRVWLALTGEIPTAAEARAFFADPAPDKRARLIDRLLSTREHAHHFSVALDVMLMERRAEKHTKAAEWRAWLEEAVATNKPWNQMAGEILRADGVEEKSRPAGRWLLEREAEPNLLTRDIGRLFLGRDMACAQCHDHPRIDDYSQRDYHGLLAFVSRTYLFQPDMNKPGVVGEQPAGEASFTSVFTKVSGTTGPRLPDGAVIEEPAPPAEPWAVPPNAKDKNVRPIPNYSRRARLAEAFESGTSPSFRRNIANRLWELMNGRGLVEPADLTHSLNPPAHPALLDLLGSAIAEMKFDLRAFLREVALSRTFQRGLEAEITPQSINQLATSLENWKTEAQTVEQKTASADATFSRTRDDARSVQLAAEPVVGEWKKAVAATAEARKAADSATDAWKKAETALAGKQEVARALADASKSAEVACKATPQDNELVAVVKTFMARSDKAANEIAAAEKDVAARKAELDAKAKSMTDVQLAADAKRPPAAEAEQKITLVLHQLSDADAVKQAERVAARRAAERLREAGVAIEAGRALEQARAAEQNAAERGLDLKSGEEAMSALNARVTQRESELPAFEKAFTETAAAAEVARSNTDLRRETVRVMADAAAKATMAAQKLPDAADVQNAAAVVKNRHEQATRDLTASEAELVARTTSAGEARTRLAVHRAALEADRTAIAVMNGRLPELKNQAEAALAAASLRTPPATEAREKFVSLAADRFVIGRIKALTPEQFCWSAMKATGYFDLERGAATAEWDKKNPQTDADRADTAKQAARVAAIEKLVREKVKGHEDQFVRLFGNGAGQPQTDFFATADQALYFENAGTLRGWCSPSGDNLAARLVRTEDPKALAEELYLSVLTRTPAPDEVADVTTILATRGVGQKPAAVTDLIWALLTSVEFRFRH